jgi:hypothetical protein
MKKCTGMLLVVVCCALPTKQASAQLLILDLIKAAAKKAIKAIDLQVQRLQNKTIWLQNAQKVLENSMSETKLGEIGDWVGKQKDLYQQYFDELAQVKTIISYYKRIREITEKQATMMTAYKHAWSLIQQDKHFTPSELDYISRVYSGLLDESVKNLDQVSLIIQSFTTKMSDAKRMELINAAADRVEENYSNLLQFNNENAMLSLQRAKGQNEVQLTKALYGIQ